ncbi:MAG TPA: hypothetical protein VLB67_13135 [Acidimicrobiia bacterium]|nr:hypothetical protein [Acidimicrobiia bacterium]
MRAITVILSGAVGFLIGVALQAPGGGVAFTDWRGPVASLTTMGFFGGTASGLGLDEEPIRRGIAGSVVGGSTGLVLGLAGSGIVLTAVVGAVLVASLVVGKRE